MRLAARYALGIAAMLTGLAAMLLASVALGSASTRLPRPVGARGVLHGVGRGVVYRHDAAGVRAASRQVRASACSVSCSGPLAYHGGAVMHSHTTYAIYWAPPVPAANGQLGTSFTAFEATYKNTIDTFLERVGAESGKLTNVYSADVQYGEPSGGVYGPTFGKAFSDEKLYPSRNTTLCPESSNGGEDGLPLGSGPCLTDAQLKAELKSFVKEQGLPSGLGAMYFIFTPQGVASCAGGSGSTAECSTNVYCAYHFETISPTLIYANMPYDHVPGCETPAEPNGTPADDELSTLSHEHNEAVTDPTGEGWYYGEFVEDGDKCTYPFFNPGEDSNESTDAYGPLLGGSSGSTGYNQEIGGGHYLLQREWSNAAGGCVTRAPGVHAAIAVSQQSERKLSFNGLPSSTEAGQIVEYKWEFGDTQSASGGEVEHEYASTGEYVVKLKVKNDSGVSGETTIKVTLSPGSSGTVTTTSTTTATTTSTVTKTTTTPVTVTTTTTGTETLLAAPVTTTVTASAATTPPAKATRRSASEIAKLLGLPAAGAKLPGLVSVSLGHAHCPLACGVHVKVVATLRGGGHVKRLQIGSLNETIAENGTGSISLKLTGKGRKLLRKAHRLRVTLIVSVEDSAGGSWAIERKLTLTADRHAAR